MKPSINFCDKNHFLILKAIAIISIIIGHVGNFSGKPWFTPLGGFGVAIFLFCSGYGLTVSSKKGGVSKYWSKKFVAVYFPFFIIECIASLILKRTLTAFIFDITFIKMAHPYGWYMQYIFACYLLFYLIYVFIKNENVKIVIFIILGIISFFVFPNLQAEQALSFVSGIIAANYINVKSTNKNKFLLLGFLLIFVGLVFLAIKQLPVCRAANHYLVTLLNLIIKYSAAMGVVMLSYLFSYFLKLLHPIGKISYELYLVHGYFIFILSEKLSKSFMINSLCFLILVFLVSWIFYILTTQFQKAFRRLIKIEPKKSISD